MVVPPVRSSLSSSTASVVPKFPGAVGLFRGHVLLSGRIPASKMPRKMILSSCQGQLVAESWPSDSDFGFERYLTIGLPSYCLGHDSYKAAKPQPPISIPVPSMWPMGTKGLSSTPRTPAWSREICWEAQVASCEASSAQNFGSWFEHPSHFQIKPSVTWYYDVLCVFSLLSFRSWILLVQDCMVWGIPWL